MENSKADAIAETSIVQPLNDENRLTNEKESTSSSSSSSSSEESFEIVGTGANDVFTFEVVAPNFDNFFTGPDTSNPNPNNIFHVAPTTITNSDNEVQPSNNASPTQSPTAQVMERQPEPYRIPSSVFARTKSSAQGEWSTASNESLFSIHMGNASFTRDSAAWFGASGELGLHADPNIDYSSNQPPSVQAQNIKSNESPKQNPIETVKEVTKENETDEASKQKLTPKISLCGASFRRSDASAASIKSFAFPILTGDKGSQKKNPPSPQPTQGSPEPPSQLESPKVDHSQSKNKAQAGAAPAAFNPSKWFSCLFCCSSSSS